MKMDMEDIEKINNVLYPDPSEFEQKMSAKEQKYTYAVIFSVLLVVFIFGFRGIIEGQTLTGFLAMVIGYVMGIKKGED